MAITLDFTGLYYEIDFLPADLPKGLGSSVREVTEFAKNKYGKNRGKLTEVVFSDDPDPKRDGYLTTAVVEFDTAPPETRQKFPNGHPSPSRPLPLGRYGYTDNGVCNRVPGVPGGVDFAIAWQYYILRNGTDLVSGPTPSQIADGEVTERTIVPAEQSAGPTPLRDGDVIRWRLVAIGALPNLADEMLRQMPQERAATVIAGAYTNNLGIRGIVTTSDEGEA